MKKIAPFFFLLISIAFPHFLPAQAELGISGGAILMFPNYVPYSNSAYGPQQVHHIRHLQPGLRLEGNYLLHGYTFPVTSFNGVGIAYYPATKDSAFYTATHHQFGSMEIKGFEKTSLLVAGLRVGYEIPQEFNDFLTIHAGWGFSLITQRTKYLLPDQSPQFNYTQADFDDAAFLTQKTHNLGIELFAGATYEFEKFFLVGQYSFLYAFGEEGYTRTRFRHGLSVSVFVPLKRF